MQLDWNHEKKARFEGGLSSPPWAHRDTRDGKRCVILNLITHLSVVGMTRLCPGGALAPMGQAGSGDELRKSRVFLRGTWERKALRWAWGEAARLERRCSGLGVEGKVGPEAQAWWPRLFHRDPQQHVSPFPPSPFFLFFFLTAFLCISYSAQKLLTPVQKSVIQVWAEWQLLEW